MSLQSSKGPGISRPSPARAFDFLLCGAGHGAADRVAVVSPEARDLAWENGRFLAEAVRHMAGRGVRQFLDIGSGLPLAGSVSEVARAVRPDARVVYVDDDPLVHAQARALIPTDERTAFVEVGVRRPKAILDHPETIRVLDPGEPTGVLLLSVMHFVHGEDDPYGLVARVMDAMPPGSCLGLAHVTSDDLDPGVRRRIDEVYNGTAAPLVLRTTAEIMRFFDGLRVLVPGLVDVGAWDADGAAEFKPGPMRLLGAVAVKP
ncbi:SAM-dependent methyltransferase [Streptosporangium sp. KLBMP 9127]|nr:SAM-dependent methyltransferase [Streptosporangium sp. KLBMP 9127]